MNIKIGILGSGYMAREHLKVFKILNNLKLLELLEEVKEILIKLRKNFLK